jgi:hypothetical protein
MKHLRGKLTYANVVATLALFAALAGGTAFAASKVLPKNSVGTKQLKNTAVTTPKIKNGAITGVKLAPGAVGATQINTSGLTVPNATHASSADSASNANALGGKPASAYGETAMWALVDKSGAVLQQSGGVTVQALGGGLYQVTFPRVLAGISTAGAFVNDDTGNRGSVEVGVCSQGLSCGGLGIPNDPHVAVVVTTSSSGGNEEHAFWIVGN